MKTVLALFSAMAIAAAQNAYSPRASAVIDGNLIRPSGSSPSGEYVITFPAPNDCVVLRARSTSRAIALYEAVSHGGFTLLPGRGGLTVWTAEEWAETELMLKNEDWAKAAKARCASAKQ